MTRTPDSAGLLVVDVQNDFCPGGSLPVPDGDAVVPVLNQYIELFRELKLPIVLSRDWHPAESRHFRDFGGRWPAHCVQNTHGAGFHAGLVVPASACVVSKGTSPDDEGYSAFEGRDASGALLKDFLVRLGVGTLYVGGLATEYCVRASVLDALASGLRVVLLTDAIRALDDPPGAGGRAVEEMQRAGAALATLPRVVRTLRHGKPVGAHSYDAKPGVFVSGPITIEDVALLTDLYEITMAAAYFRQQMHGPATFSLFSRKLPPTRGFLVAAGLESVLEYLRTFRFSSRAIDHLASLRQFDADFIDFLRDLRFTGSVRAVAEGTAVFPDEPLVEITAPIIEAQLVESVVLNIIHLQTLLASKAARVVLAAAGRPVVEFGLRRTHGLETALCAARCAYIAGATMTSDVLASLWHGFPATGTMAHSFVAAFPDEIESFRAFAETFPAGTTLLLDTYDTIAATHKAVVVAREMEARGARLASVRLDSGDLLVLSRAVRQILDDANLSYVKIFASGGLDEVEMTRLINAAAPIDAFGVGTRMTTSADAPYLDMAYKLVRYDGRDVLKLSTGKETWTGEKQVYRYRDAHGMFDHDEVRLRDEAGPNGGGTALLEDVMRSGQLLRAHPPLSIVRDHCALELQRLPSGIRGLRGFAPYTVRYSPALVALQRRLEQESFAREIGTPVGIART